jgi:hypothetical protein
VAAQHVIWGAEQAPLIMVQLQTPQLCWLVGGSPESFSGITPPGHVGFGPPTADTRTSFGPVHPLGTASMQTAPSPHGFTIPVPVDELLEPLLLVVEPLPPPEPEGEPPSPPLADELLAPPPPPPVSSNVNGVGTHAATDMTAPSDATARRIAPLALLAL